MRMFLVDGEIETKSSDYGFDMELHVSQGDEFATLQMDLKEVLALSKILGQFIDKEASKSIE